jgi:hypothetical protein
MAVARLIGPINTISIERARPCIRQIAVPDLIGVLWQRHTIDLAYTRGIEEAELHSLGMPREQGEVDALTVPGRTQRIGFARPDAGAWRGWA